MLAALAAVAGALAAWAGVIVTVLMVLWNKQDKRFDDFEARQNRRFDQQDKRFDELAAEMRDNRAEMRALREALLSGKAPAKT
ncbi:MAG: hypothetical protein F4226_07320 [Synechococcus sp. SB0678_bin_12]|nr:hypothetical protein [Synechococcus sp. SB0678_bin_12]